MKTVDSTQNVSCLWYSLWTGSAQSCHLWHLSYFYMLLILALHILFACFIPYASPLILFSSLFPYLFPPLLIFSFVSRPDGTKPGLIFWRLFCVVHFFWLVNACFCCVRFSFFIRSQETGSGNVSEVTYFVSSGTWNHSSVSYVVAVVSRTSQATAAETFPVQPPHRRQFARIVESRTSFRCGPCVFAVCLVQFVFVPVCCAGTTI